MKIFQHIVKGIKKAWNWVKAGLQETCSRLIAETPAFFVKVRNIALVVATASSSSAVFYGGLPESVMGFIPSWLVRSMAITGFIAAFVAQCARKDPNQETNTPA